MKPFAVGQNIGNLTGDEVRTVFTVTGGMNLAKESFMRLWDCKMIYYLCIQMKWIWELELNIVDSLWL